MDRFDQEEGDNKGQKPGVPGVSGYLASVEACAAAVERLPRGWHAIYLDAMRALAAMDCDKRSGVVVAGPFRAEGTVVFMASARDSKVEGALRRLSARLSAACQRCGRHARRRALGAKWIALCAHCYAPRALRIEAGRTLRSLRQRTNDDELASMRVAMSPLLRVAMDPDGTWDVVGRLRQDGSLEVPAKMLNFSIDRLAALHQRLSQLVHETQRQCTHQPAAASGLA